MSSTTVTKRSDTTKTPNTKRSTTGQRTPPGRDPATSAGGADAGGSGGSEGDAICRVAAGPAGAGSGAASGAASGAVAALVPVSSVGAEESPGVDSVMPAALVPPRRRSNEVSGARTTTCLTALFVRSMDWKARAVPVVAAMEPRATPTIVPLTPKTDAMTADSTAPAADARIWR